MDEKAIREKLASVREEHRDLDEAISALEEGNTFDALRVQRLKKRKLSLKDQMIKLEALLVPDIIA